MRDPICLAARLSIGGSRTESAFESVSGLARIIQTRLAACLQIKPLLFCGAAPLRYIPSQIALLSMR